MDVVRKRASAGGRERVGGWETRRARTETRRVSRTVVSRTVRPQGAKYAAHRRVMVEATATGGRRIHDEACEAAGARSNAKEAMSRRR